MPPSVSRPKKTAKRRRSSRGMPAKEETRNQPTGSVSSIDSIEEPIVPAEPPKEVTQKTVKCLSFPFDDPSGLHGTIKAVQKAVTGVLDHHNVRCNIPVDEMDTIIKRMENLLAYRKMDRIKGEGPVLEAPIDEAFALLSEENVGMDKSILCQQLLKYILIASSKFDKLSTGTLMSIVEDLNDSSINLGEYENGYPARVASTVSEFYGLTDKEFQSLNLPIQLKMKKEYVKAGIVYCQEVKKFLKEKHESMMERGREEEEREREDKLIESFKKNLEQERRWRIEYGCLEYKEHEAGTNQYRVDFRTMRLGGKKGAITKKEEEQIDRDFYQSPFRAIKIVVDEWKKGMEEEEEEADENAMEIE